MYAIGVGRGVNVSCGVLASPPSVRFSWVFNNSMSSERLPGDQVFTMPGKDGRKVWVCVWEEGRREEVKGS